MAEVNASAPLCNDHEGLLNCRHVTDFRWQVSSPPDSCRRLMKHRCKGRLTQGNMDGWMDRWRDLPVTFNNGANF